MPTRSEHVVGPRKAPLLTHQNCGLNAERLPLIQVRYWAIKTAACIYTLTSYIFIYYYRLVSDKTECFLLGADNQLGRSQKVNQQKHVP